jgi:hypothetical protein
MAVNAYFDPVPDQLAILTLRKFQTGRSSTVTCRLRAERASSGRSGYLFSSCLRFSCASDHPQTGGWPPVDIDVVSLNGSVTQQILANVMQ